VAVRHMITQVRRLQRNPGANVSFSAEINKLLKITSIGIRRVSRHPPLKAQPI
jgi:hypothetical protein